MTSRLTDFAILALGLFLLIRAGRLVLEGNTAMAVVAVVFVFALAWKVFSMFKRPGTAE